MLPPDGKTKNKKHAKHSQVGGSILEALRTHTRGQLFYTPPFTHRGASPTSPPSPTGGSILEALVTDDDGEDGDDGHRRSAGHG